MGIVPTTKAIDTSSLYRMPWTMSDNGFSWLEPTRECNMSCEYCYQKNDKKSQKSLTQIELEMKTMMRLRKCDSMIIAGGEPLTHPKIVEITQMVKSYNVKPIILTNGLALTPSLLHDLKTAGAYGIVFHVDSHQYRPGWENKGERELNSVRQEFADMVHEEGGLICAYNTTILPETLDEVPDIVEWTFKNVHKVAANILIPVRAASEDDPWAYYAGTQKIEISKTPYSSSKRYKNLSALDICQKIWQVYPHYSFHSYLGGTIRPDVPKWLFGTHIGSKRKLYGNLGPKAAEIIQSIYHMVKGKYLSFNAQALNRKAWLLFPFCATDGEVRKSFKCFFNSSFFRPGKWFERLSIQNIIVMQPNDVLPNGEQDQCDGCPNKTYWNGRLVSECRKEDYLIYGRPIIAVRKQEILPEVIPGNDLAVNE